MKQLIVFGFCLLSAGTLLAQNNSTQPKNTTTPKSAVAAKPGTAKGNTGSAGARIVKKSGPSVSGYILDARKHPITDVHAFIYAPDSSIIASGFTDATGHYATNAVMPGQYRMKIVYPSAKQVIINGVVLKNGETPLNITAAEPEADTTLPFTYFAPVPEKKKGSNGAQKK